MVTFTIKEQILVSQIIWSNPPDRVKLNENEVHVWRAVIDLDENDTPNYLNLLSPDERQRTERFHFPADRNRFIARRGILRCLLSGYTQCPAEQIKFEYSAFGKPSLVKSLNTGQTCFSLSHSNGIVLYAISRQEWMGIDMEFMRDDLELASIAAATFSPWELEQLRLLPETDFKEAFFNCWTRKEAFIKATGKGFSFPLKNFDVSLLPDQEAKILRVSEHPEAFFSWQLDDLPVEPGFKAALVIRRENQDLKICFWNYSGFVKKNQSEGVLSKNSSLPRYRC